MHDVGYTPKAIMAQSAGFVEQAFIDAVGPLAEGVMSRSAFALDAAKARPAIPAVNALYKARNNKDLNDNTGREIIALMVLADAINRAGSTDEEKIRQALVATDIPGDQTIMPWKGIKFDEHRAEYRGDAGDPADQGRQVPHDLSVRCGGRASGVERREVTQAASSPLREGAGEAALVTIRCPLLRGTA